MEYSKLTKQELINHIESLTCEDCGDLKASLNDANYKIKDLQKSNDEIRKSEYDFKSESLKTIANQQATIQRLEKESGDLKVSLNDANYKIKDLQKSNDEIRKSEYDFRSESSKIITNQKATIDGLQNDNKELKGQVKFMEGKFNELAQIFEEYVKAFKDQNALLGAFNRNREYIESYLDLKINKFNNGGD
jgi:predicted RNase H-like nuclease (RuvC/YqgF family)